MPMLIMMDGIKPHNQDSETKTSQNFRNQNIMTYRLLQLQNIIELKTQFAE